MNVKCPLKKCCKQFSTATDLIHHVKDYHKTPTHYELRCTFPGCLQIFSTFSNFKKHVLNHRFKAETVLLPSEKIFDTVAPMPIKKQKIDDCSSSMSDVLPDLPDSLNEPQKLAVEFTLALHKKNNFTRNDVQDVQNATNKFVGSILNKIEDLNLKTNNHDSQNRLETLLSTSKTAFEIINTEHKFLNHIKRLGIFEPPVVITLEKGIPTVESNNFADHIGRKNCLALNPIQFQLKKFFETGGIMQKVLDQIDSLEKSDNVNHFVNGRVWKNIKNKYKYDNPATVCIPLWMYADEYEINDSQGPHNKVDSVCGIYFHCPCLPENMISKLSSILVAGIVRKVTIHETGVDALVKELIAPFVKLEEEGMMIQIEEKSIKVRFILSLFQGDNLGVHSLLSLSRGFNASYYCRFCRKHKNQAQRDCSVSVDDIRTIQNYNEDIMVDDHSRTGLSGQSMFNQLPSFHVIENISVDAMHDLFSNGVCKYGLSEALNYFICDKKYLTLANVNSRKTVIGQMSLDGGLRRMPDLEQSYDSIKKMKTVKMRMSADEMRSFCNYFTLIVGPYVPIDDPVWKYCKILITMVDQIMAKEFKSSDIENLEKTIVEHHELYQSLFKLSLKPKHHFILHYPKVIVECGPVSRMMCFRNEAKHQSFKQYAHVITSRVNIAFTLCMKSCLQFSYDVYTDTFQVPSTQGNFKKNNILSRAYYNQITNLPFDKHDTIEFTSTITFNGYQYSCGNFITCNKHTELYEIEEFIKHNNLIEVIGRHWTLGVFNEHYLAIEATERQNILSVIDIRTIDGPPFRIHDICNKFMFRNKCDF